MTPEELAERVLYNYFSYEGTRELEEYPAWSAELRAGIVAAIRQAIAAEREACAGIAGAKFTEHNNWLKNTDDPTERARALGGSLTAKSIEVLIRGRE